MAQPELAMINREIEFAAERLNASWLAVGREEEGAFEAASLWEQEIRMLEGHADLIRRETRFGAGRTV